MENAEGDFVLRHTGGGERFVLALTPTTLFITVRGKENFTFLADITEAEQMRDWLVTKTALESHDK